MAPRRGAPARSGGAAVIAETVAIAMGLVASVGLVMAMIVLESRLASRQAEACEHAGGSLQVVGDPGTTEHVACVP